MNLEVIKEIEEKLTLLLIGSCNCGTKSPHPLQHELYCMYRNVEEARKLLYRAREWVEGVELTKKVNEDLQNRLKEVGKDG